MKRVILFVSIFSVFTTAAMGCTFIYFSNGKICLAGNNEDWKDPNTFMWFIPGENGSYGRVYFGFGNRSTQGGMNEKGLCFDGLATSPKPVTGSQNKPTFQGDIMDHILSTCTTVEEALAVLNQYNLAFMERFMLMMSDAAGQSVIIEGDDVIFKNKDYQICTNFRQSQFPGEHFPCPRYNIADSLFQNSDRTGSDLIRQILAAVHSERNNPTQYSNIYDLTNKTVTIYHFHNYENGYTFNLEEELAKGPHMVKLKDLFPQTYAAEVFAFVNNRERALEEALAKRSTVDLDSTQLAEYVGKYQFDQEKYPGAVLNVFLEDGVLYCTLPKMQKKAEMKAESKDCFFFVDSNNPVIADVDFFRNDKGEITTAILTNNQGKQYNIERIR
jgi:hypothetical protein